MLIFSQVQLDDNPLARWKAMKERQQKKMELRSAWFLAGIVNESSSAFHNHKIIAVLYRGIN